MFRFRVTNYLLGFAMTLKLINNKIVFTPNFPDIEASLLETYDTILRGKFYSKQFITSCYH